MDRELHKANRVFPEKTLLKYCLGSSVKAGFTQGMEKQMGCLGAMGYMWEVKGCRWEMYATAIVCQSFFNLSCSPNKTHGCFWHSLTLQRTQLPSGNCTVTAFQLLHALSVVFVFPSLHNTGPERTHGSCITTKNTVTKLTADDKTTNDVNECK